MATAPTMPDTQQPTTTATQPRSSKRKRNQVSYTEPDFEDLDLDAVEEDEAAFSEDDDSFGTAKKKGKTPAKKKVKLSASKPKKEKKVPPFRFLDLPAELRDEIYELALTEPDGITLCSRTKSHRRIVARGTIETAGSDYYYGRRRRNYGGFGWWRGYRRRNESSLGTIGQLTRHLVPNLLAVSKQLRAEAGSILYKQEIILEDTTALHTFLTQIGSYNKELLTDVTIKGWGSGRGVTKGHNFAAMSALSACTNLQIFFIDCTVGWHRSPKQLARQIYRDGHYFLEAFSTAQGRYDAALDVLRFDDDWHFKKQASRNQSGESQGEGEADPKKKKEFEDELRKLLSRSK